MARVKITEYAAKRVLFEDYQGLEIGSAAPIPEGGSWVAKVDEGIKKRFKQGLVALEVSGEEAARSVRAWNETGFSRFLLESYLPHDAKEEQYVSFERVREGIRVLFSPEGGVDVEAHPERILSLVIRGIEDVSSAAEKTKLPEAFLARVVHAFDAAFFSFLEINPLVVRGSQVYALDAAALVDSAGAFFTDAWSEKDIVRAKAKHVSESRVEALDATTPASLKLSVLHPDGSLFFLLSAGGGSIVIADQAQILGLGGEIANYGEYSGGPSREETFLYAKEVLGLLLDSKAPKKALVIAGPVANFTDVRTTFLGIIDALSEHSSALRDAGVKVFVRRGGPNESAGLSLMEEFLSKERLLGSVHGSDAPITSAVEDAARFLRV